MRRWVVVLAFAVVGCGGQGDAWDLLIALEDAGVISCEPMSAAERADYYREQGETEQASCGPGSRLVILNRDWPDTDIDRAVRRDHGWDTPVVAGDGWYVLVIDDIAFAVEVADVLGGELITP